MSPSLPDSSSSSNGQHGASHTVMRDVLIAGGGLAGSAVAIQLGRLGVSVELFECGRFPKEKPCGEGLMPSGVATLVMLCLSANPQTGSPANYAVNSEKSKLQISVFKEGLFKAFGHDHLISASKVSGSVRFDAQTLADSSVDLAVKANSLTVVDPDGSDTDRREVQSTMAGKDVLDTEKNSEIHFISTGVKGEKTDDGWEVTLEGRLTLHGVEKPIGLPLRLTKRAGELSADGDVALLQTDFGITPIKVGGGAVKVKDKIRIHFDVVADALGP